MIFDQLYVLKAIFLGLMSGYFSGQFGLGGGLITTPGIRLYLKESAAVALGTPLVVIIPATLTASYAYYQNKMIDGKVARAVITSGLIGILAGAMTTTVVDLEIVMMLTAFAILSTGLLFLFRPHSDLLTRSEGTNGAPAEGETDPRLHLKCAVTGAVSGFYSGALGMGGGILIVPFLVYWFRFGIKKAFGTSLIINLGFAAPGAIVHYFLGHVDTATAFWLTLGVIPGAYLGSKIALGLSEVLLRRMFGTFLLLVAAYFLYFEATVVLARAG